MPRAVYTNPMAIISWAVSDYTKIKKRRFVPQRAGHIRRAGEYIGIPKRSSHTGWPGQPHGLVPETEMARQDVYPLLREKAEDRRFIRAADAHWAGPDVVRAESSKLSALHFDGTTLEWDLTVAHVTTPLVPRLSCTCCVDTHPIPRLNLSPLVASRIDAKIPFSMMPDYPSGSSRDTGATLNFPLINRTSQSSAIHTSISVRRVNAIPTQLDGDGQVFAD